MAFYGESYALSDLTNIDGTAADFGALYYHRDDESSSVTAGDSFLVGVWADPVEFGDLVDATDAVVSWVVETGEGSSGTLAISSGLDPTGAVTNTAYASEALGSFSVTGTQTVVAGPTSITSADLVAFDDEPVAFIQCTSGVVNILQVKLRVWPPTGAGGNWATGSAYERVGDRSFWSSEPNNQETAQVDGYAAAWALGRSDIDGLEGVPQGFLLGSDDMAQNFSLSHSATIPPFQEFADTSMQVVLLSATPPHVTTAGPGILGGVDPREHQYEDEAWARAVGGGPIAPTFIEWIEPATAFIDNIGQVGFEEVGAPSFTPHPTLPGWVLGTMTIPTPDGVTRAAGDHVPILQTEHQVIGVFAPNYFANPGTSSVSGTTGGLDSFFSNWLVPPYEYWDPAAPSVTPRFFVKDLEGEWRPVGFGKPDSETAVFKVPAATGSYRDLTTAEYATYGPDDRPPGGYPLKVKRLNADGSTWWDHVGWMVPET